MYRQHFFVTYVNVIYVTQYLHMICIGLTQGTAKLLHQRCIWSCRQHPLHVSYDSRVIEQALVGNSLWQCRWQWKFQQHYKSVDTDTPTATKCLTESSQQYNNRNNKFTNGPTIDYITKITLTASQ